MAFQAFAVVATLAVAAAGSKKSFRMKKVVEPAANAWYMGDPFKGCMPTEQNVSVTGIPGDFCSPPCTATQGCPTPIEPGMNPATTGQCVLEEPGQNQPTLCALICTPGAAKACGVDATCQPIQGVGVCSYPFNKL